MNIELRENIDGSFELYNLDIGDIYFSNVGAHKEAMEKFVLPAIQKNNGNKKLKILDVCYGMGYNSKSFVDYCLKNNLEFEFNIDAIELDKDILALSLLIFDKNIDDNIHLYFGNNLLEQIDMNQNLKNILSEEWIKYFLTQLEAKIIKKMSYEDIYLHQKDKILTFLHNIYYQNQTKSKNTYSKLHINFLLGNLLELLPAIHTKYDLIFHDAFSILKQPELWSTEVMQQYYNILNIGGLFLTYSNSRVLRRTLEEVGFSVEINTIGDRKQNGTIGRKL